MSTLIPHDLDLPKEQQCCVGLAMNVLRGMSGGGLWTDLGYGRWLNGLRYGISVPVPPPTGSQV